MAVALNTQDIPEIRVLGNILRDNGVTYAPTGKEAAQKQSMESLIASKGAEGIRVSGEYEQTHKPPTENKDHALNSTEVKRKQGKDADLAQDPNQKMQDDFKKSMEKFLTFGDSHGLDGQKSLNEAWEHLNPLEKKMWGAAAGAVMAWKQGRQADQAQQDEAKKMTIDEICKGIKEIGTEALRKGQDALKSDPGLNAAFEELKGVEKAMDAVKAHKAEEKRAERTGEKTASPGRESQGRAKSNEELGMGAKNTGLDNPRKETVGHLKPEATPNRGAVEKSGPAMGGH